MSNSEMCPAKCPVDGCGKPCMWTRAHHADKPSLVHVCTGRSRRHTWLEGLA